MSEESEHASEDLPGVTDNTSGHGRECECAKVYVPLNSTRVTTGQLRGLGTELGVPTSSSVGDLRVMIEAKLREMDREPSNVQVALPRNPEDTSFSLVDHSGVFLTVEPRHELPVMSDEPSGSRGTSPALEPATSNERIQALTQERDELQGRVETLTDDNSTLLTELHTLLGELESSKARVKEIWKISCEQVAEFEEVMAAKDTEISQLKLQLAARRDTRATSPSDTSSTSAAAPTVTIPVTTATTREPRRGRAPPINFFSGEDSEVCLDDWLPSLRRASQWNNWTTEEQLLQLAGHLKGRALAEWNLLTGDEAKILETAVKFLKERLDPCSRVLAGQDFRRTVQGDTETVADFICRLEKSYRVAFGNDRMSRETKDAMLYGKLQEGLRLSLIRSPSVSGAMTYQELCMAAKHEEKRQTEMKKRQEYNDSLRTTHHRDKFIRKSRDDRPNLNQSGTTRTTMKDTPNKIRCYLCHKLGHVAANCKASNKEQEATGNLGPKKDTKGGTKNRQVGSTDAVSPPTQDKVKSTPLNDLDPLALLYSSDSDGSVSAVRVNDQGSKPQYVNVTIQGVATSGIIDTGADITIMGGELFKKISDAVRLKKRDFKKPDRIPHTYDHKKFKLHGRMDLEIGFDDKVITTPVYIKMDAHDQLLMSEGVCSQLGIVEYHDNVWPGREPEALVGEENVTVAAKVPVVRNFRVRLLRSITIPANKAVTVPVYIAEGELPMKSLLFEGHDYVPAVTATQALLNTNKDGHARIEICNERGFTEKIPVDTVVGEVTEVQVIESVENELIRDEAVVGMVTTGSNSERKQKLTETIEVVNLSEPERTLLLDLLRDYHDIFALEENDRGQTDLIQLEVDTGDVTPIKQPSRRMQFAAREEVAKQLRKMRQMQVVQPSKSPWSSPVVLVRKKDGLHRFCIDYRGLNAVTKGDSFPLPRIDDLLDDLGSARYFSTLDLASGFWQIPVHERSREKTAFSTPFGLFEFRMMPFGLKNAPSVFQRLMQQVLTGVNPENGPSFVVAYIDDLLVFSSSLEAHLNHLSCVMKRIREVGLKVNPSKCQFIRKEVEYLGHVITPEGLRPNDKLVGAVKDYLPLKNVQELKRFLGLASYYRRFVHQFSKVAHSLHRFTCKDVEFRWSEECQAAFDKLKELLITSPILAYPNFQRDFVLETDASHQGLGAVLSQVQSDGRSHPIAYASRGLTPAEKNYGITDLETLAVVWSISHFHYYLYGHKVTVYSDHSAVKAVLETSSPSGRHARWWTRVYG